MSAQSYGQILRSSALMGGASAINIAVGIIRTKIMAIVLGPSGVGLAAAFAAIADLSRSLAEAGVTQGGVRQIADTAASGDHRRLRETAAVLQKTALGLGLVGAVSLWLAAEPLARLTFGSDLHAESVALLGLALLFGVLTSARTALLQGLRRIADLARISALGTGLGAVISIGFVVSLGERGIVPAIVGSAAAGAVLAIWFSRKAGIALPSVPVKQFCHLGLALLRLGLAFMASAVVTMAASYAVRIIVLRSEGLEGVGLFQTGWTLGGLYVGFILQAMSTDFYPRLVGAANEPAVMNRLVNEQMRMSMLLAGPGVVFTVAFAPLITVALYSEQFAGAVEVLRWVCIGMALRVITWPMGFIVIASDRRKVFVAVDFVWAVVNVALSWWLVGIWGVAGAGIAFTLSYLFHAAVIYPLVRRMTGFRLDRSNIATASCFLSMAGLAFVAASSLPLHAGQALAAVALATSCWYSLRCLLKLVGVAAMPRSVTRLLSLLRIVSP